ncbi:MAG: hypothetical protein AAF587_10280 [Bacteroidota bacterium]
MTPRTNKPDNCSIPLALSAEEASVSLRKSIWSGQLIVALVFVLLINAIAWRSFVRLDHPSLDDCLFPLFGLAMLAMLIWVRFGVIRIRMDAQQIQFTRQLFFFTLSKSRPLSSIQDIRTSSTEGSTNQANQRIHIQFDQEQVWTIDAGLTLPEKQWLAGELSFWFSQFGTPNS